MWFRRKTLLTYVHCSGIYIYIYIPDFYIFLTCWSNDVIIIISPYWCTRTTSETPSSIVWFFCWLNWLKGKFKDIVYAKYSKLWLSYIFVGYTFSHYAVTMVTLLPLVFLNKVHIFRAFMINLLQKNFQLQHDSSGVLIFQRAS